MRYFSMFSGIGGFEVGIEEACAESDVEQYRREHPTENPRCGFGMESRWDGQLSGHHGVECIGFSEIDRYACSIYRRHFPEHKNYGDATKLNPRDLPDFDLLVGGFPCQAFSIAGKRAGFMDARGTLFFEIARVLEHKRPRYFLLENVEGLLSDDNRKTYVRIIGVLSDLDYSISAQLLNSKDYGLPQNRERIFIAGRFGGERGPEVFPIREDGETNHRERQLAKCLSGGAHSGGLHSDMIGIRLKNTRIRRLTPTECCRLQGFPDDWCDWGIDDKGNKVAISDTQKYRCLGNAVSTNVIARIISGWKELTS